MAEESYCEHGDGKGHPVTEEAPGGYSEGYLHGMEDGAHAERSLAALAAEHRGARRRQGFRLALAVAAAWLVGSAVGDTMGALARWVDEPAVTS